MAEGGGEGFYSMLSELSFPHIKKYSPGTFEWLFEVKISFYPFGTSVTLNVSVKVCQHNKNVIKNFIPQVFFCRKTRIYIVMAFVKRSFKDISHHFFHYES